MLLGVSTSLNNRTSGPGTFPVNLKEGFDWTSQVIIPPFSCSMKIKA